MVTIPVGLSLAYPLQFGNSMHTYISVVNRQGCARMAPDDTYFKRSVVRRETSQAIFDRILRQCTLFCLLREFRRGFNGVFVVN